MEPSTEDVAKHGNIVVGKVYWAYDDGALLAHSSMEESEGHRRAEVYLHRGSFAHRKHKEEFQENFQAFLDEFW